MIVHAQFQSQTENKNENKNWKCLNKPPADGVVSERKIYN